MMDIKDFKYYLVVTDSNNQYIISYGYDVYPNILELKYVFSQLVQETDLIELIPDWSNNVDYTLIKIMKKNKFVKYMKTQNILKNKNV